MSNGNNKDGHGRTIPPLPLVPEPLNEDQRYYEFKLYSVPSDKDSPKYTFRMPIINGEEHTRVAIEFFTKIRKVLTGLNLPKGVAQDNLIKQVLEGEALSIYNTTIEEEIILRYDNNRKAAIKAQTTDTIGTVNYPSVQKAKEAAAKAVPKESVTDKDILKGVQAIVKYMTPYKGLEKQKRWMRRYCRKPFDMTTRTYVNHLKRINNEELGVLPPFKANNRLSETDLVDIITHGLPRRWLKEMDRMDFDPLEKSIKELVDFCQRMESTEEMDKDSNTTKAGSSSKDSKSKKKSKTGNRFDKSNKKGEFIPKTDKHCAVHGACGHSTEECRTIKNMKTPSGSNKNSYQNKTWNRKSNDAAKQTKKELAVLIGKTVRKELNAVAKKESKKRTASKDADSDGESVNLAEFNYKDMEKLSLEDKKNKDDDTISINTADIEIDDVDIDNLEDGEISVWNGGQNDITCETISDDSSLESNQNSVWLQPISNSTYRTLADTPCDPPLREGLFATEEDFKSLDHCIDHVREENGELFSILNLVRGQPQPPKKKRRLDDVKPIVFVLFKETA